MAKYRIKPVVDEAEQWLVSMSNQPTSWRVYAGVSDNLTFIGEVEAGVPSIIRHNPLRIEPVQPGYEASISCKG